MPKTKAQAVVTLLDASKPFMSRFEFVEALAALAAVFPEDMSRKVTGANKRVDHVLWCAADPDRAEWLFNNLRWRHSLGWRLRSCTPQVCTCSKTVVMIIDSTTLVLQVCEHWACCRQELHPMKPCTQRSRIGSRRHSRSTRAL